MQLRQINEIRFLKSISTSIARFDRVHHDCDFAPGREFVQEGEGGSALQRGRASCFG